jgi:hypothetical protein
MPLSFLAPVFLAGLAALAIPVLIHLANRPRKEVVEFPSLMFLEMIEYQASSRRRLRDLVLFALRVLALVLVVAAFARPYLDRPDAPAMAPDGGREVVVLLDRSASMGVDDRLDRARAAVAEVAEGLRRGDRATLILFDHGATSANRATDQPPILRRAADTVEAGAGATRFAPALRLAQSILSGSPLPRREAVVISDFQRAGWDPSAVSPLPVGTELRLVPVGAEADNVFVADVEFGRERFSGRDRARISARVATRGGGGEVDVELSIDGRTLQTRTVQVEPGGVETVGFDPVTVPDRPARGVVRAGSDALPADNAFHFVLSSSRSLRVLVVRPRSGAAPYLARALEVGPEHRIATVTADRMDREVLADVDVVVLDGADLAETDALTSFVDAGGGLIVALGPRSRAGTWNDAGLLPGSLGGTRDASRGVLLAGIRHAHPVFEPFRESGGLTGARFYRYRELEPDGEAEVLARFDDGAPAVVTGSVGAGRVVALASTFDGVWNDLVLQPGFVPLVHRLVRHASGREAAPAWRTVGDLLDAGTMLAVRSEGSQSSTGGGAGPVLLTPGDEAVAVTPQMLHPLQQPGFYELRDPRSGGDPLPVAVNMDRRESEPALLEPEVVREAIAATEAATVTASFAPEDQERRQALWWYFLAGAFLMMAAETALSNRLSRRPLRAVEGEET